MKALYGLTNLGSLGATPITGGGVPLVSAFTVDDFDFAYYGILPQPSYSWRYETVQGIRLLRAEARNGDKPSFDGVAARRRSRFQRPTVPYNTDMEVGLYYLPDTYALAQASGQFGIPFEIHADRITGDFSPEQAGPIGLCEQWSAGAGANRFRVVRRAVPISGGLITGPAVDTIVGSTGNTHAAGTLYFLRTEFKLSDTTGYLRVWQSVVTGGVKGAETQLADYSGPLGYGAARTHYMQVGLYGEEQGQLPTIAYFGVDYITAGQASVFGNGIWDDTALWNDTHIWKDAA